VFEIALADTSDGAAGGAGSTTRTEAEPDLSPAEAVMAAAPAWIPLTLPDADTVATEVLLLFQETEADTDAPWAFRTSA
jgi:hypothetical protein